MQTPDPPPLPPCPFCGRADSVATYRSAADQPVTYSVGCSKSTDRTTAEPYRDDCLSPVSDFLANLGRAVELWNTRRRPAGKG